jgi:signal transduction histidine kinase
MINPGIPINEKERLEALYSYQLLDEDSKDELNEIAGLAASICKAPISLITLIDSSVQWHKGKFGEIASFIDRDNSFCAHAICENSDMLIVEDATTDPRFINNPLVKASPNITFYAGMPLTTSEGYSLGALCIIDTKPRQLNQSQIAALNTLSKQVMHLFELHKTIREMQAKEEILEMNIQSLEEYTAFIAHDLRNPFRNIELVTEVLINKNKNILDTESLGYLKSIITESSESRTFINDLLKYSKSIYAINKDSEIVNLADLFQKILSKLLPPDRFQINMHPDLPQIFYPKMALYHVFRNIIENAFKYNENLDPIVNINYSENEDDHIISISDNGVGIAEDLHEIIFKLFSGDLVSDGKFIKSIGVGLAIVSKLVSLMDGTTSVSSKVNEGTTFTVTLPKIIDAND